MGSKQWLYRLVGTVEPEGTCQSWSVYDGDTKIATGAKTDMMRIAAAPALLEACKQLLEKCTENVSQCWCGSNPDDENEVCLPCIARQAIAQAEEPKCQS